MYQHMEPVTDKKQINKAAIEIFVFNFFAMELSIIGLLAVAYAADLVTANSSYVSFSTKMEYLQDY